MIVLCWQDLVPCVLLSFDDEQILMWRGKDWKSRYQQPVPVFTPSKAGFIGKSEISGEINDNQTNHGDNNVVNTSPKMLSLWKHAIESSKALLVDEYDLGPDCLLKRVEEFEIASQALEHSHPAFSMSVKENDSEASTATANFENSYSSDNFPAEDDDEEDYDDYHDDEDDDVVDTSAQPGSLGIDMIVKKLKQSPFE
ncbi:hypothetical protein V8G54_014593 [Vigna mungo]|uniref:Uncharacterized protein n=1 Tax=Vigna mungo TaxID=3915 RepID=A0AAQ3NJM7_VIGMU